ncbi:MAG TPA: hypothetical protein ENK23_02870, partial [Sorangium sp.]|nr:hypothetical protein [Sorangium sp.]
IGQVHRASLHDGREVAVKVQHPGIDVALEADLNNASLMERMFTSFNTAKLDSKRLLQEAKERFREELNYELEASRQRAFGESHRDHSHVIIPEVIDSHSSRRVLTSEFVRGMAFDEARQQPQALRKQWCETLWYYVYKANLIDGLFNADPHPGNYLFQENGKIAFIDYGCVQPVPPARRKRALRMHRAANRRDEHAFRDCVRAMLQLKGGTFEELAIGYTRQAFEPLFRSPYRLTTNYTAQLVNRFKDMANQVRTAKVDDHFVTLPAGMLFINRLQFGFFSVLARLDAEVDYAAVERTIYPLDTTAS